MNNILKKILLWLLVIVWLIVIFLFSEMNSTSSNHKSETTINKVIETTLDTTNNIGITNKHPNSTEVNNYVLKLNRPLRKCMHAFVYFILAIILLNALELSNIKDYRLYLICFLVCFIYAILDEYHQTFVDGRTGQFLDSLIDTFGSVIGMVLYKIIKKRQNSTKILN